MMRMMEESFGCGVPATGLRGPPGDAFLPHTDIAEENGNYVVTMDLPGADKSKINVNVRDRVLTISGESSSETEKKDGDRFIRHERRSGQFQRIVPLPGPVDADKVQAKHENGILTVTIPKAKDNSIDKSIPVY